MDNTPGDWLSRRPKIMTMSDSMPCTVKPWDVVLGEDGHY
jgi:hypothetical protein